MQFHMSFNFQYNEILYAMKFPMQCNYQSNVIPEAMQVLNLPESKKHIIVVNTNCAKYFSERTCLSTKEN